MKSEPKTPLQLRAANMIKEDELLSAAAPAPSGLENQPPLDSEFHAEAGDESDERKEVSRPRC